MIFLVGLFTLARTFFYLILTAKWRRVQTSIESGRQMEISVIIPVRNEAGIIVHLLEDLSKQTLSNASFEVVIVDDFSTDQTVQVIQDFVKESSLDISLFSLQDKAKQGKKYALTKAVELSKYDIVLTTDADCRVPETWVETFSNSFSQKTQIIAGPVALCGNGLFASLQKAEFSGLVGFGAVTLSANDPSMCSGANLAFRKQAFFEVGGYESNIKIPTGDDEFLLFDILNKYPRSGFFLKSKDAIVITQAHTSFRSFFNQRARWISKWKYNKNKRLRLLAVLFFFDYFVLIGFLFNLSGAMGWILLPILMVRYLTDLVFLRSINQFLGIKNLGLATFLLQIFYPLHVFFMGLLSIFGRYTWKGRRY